MAIYSLCDPVGYAYYIFRVKAEGRPVANSLMKAVGGVAFKTKKAAIEWAKFDGVPNYRPIVLQGKWGVDTAPSEEYAIDGLLVHEVVRNLYIEKYPKELFNVLTRVETLVLELHKQGASPLKIRNAVSKTNLLYQPIEKRYIEMYIQEFAN